jgi:hypothetical protein
VSPRRAEAEAVLRGNDRGGFSVPTSGLYPFQWLWDSGFTALGWAKFDEARAWQELDRLFEGQWPDGMLPHIIFHKPDPGYFPGPDVWGTSHDPPTSGITQPPVLASIVRHLLESAADREAAETAARRLYPKIRAFHHWLHLHRDPEGRGLVANLHPWETGADNSPAWDEPLARVPVADLPPYQRRDIGHVDPSQRPHQDQYDRYLSLVMGFKAVGYDPDRAYQWSPFRVADPGFNAILLRADQDLASLAEHLGEETDEIREWIARGERGLRDLWDPQAGWFLSLDTRTGERIPVRTSAGLLPLYAGAASQDEARIQAERLGLWAEKVRYLVPSTDPEHPSFEPRRYWRGPVWAIVNWMIAQGLTAYGYDPLAERVRADTLTLMERAGFAEYYDPNDGGGLGGFTFSWTAAIYLIWADPKPATKPQ